MSSAPSIAKPALSLVKYGNEESSRSLIAAGPFGCVISTERKRSDRSGKSFVLMLIESRRPFVQGKLLKRVADGLFSCMRDTDIAGWYRDHIALGAIFTEIVPEAAETAGELLHARAIQALRDRLTESELRDIQIRCHFYPHLDSSETDLGDSSVLYPDVQDKQQSKKTWFYLKRWIDILGSLVMLALAVPLFLLIAGVIKLTSRGPVFFRQTRIGQHGAPFTFLKFRSMLVNCDPAIHKQYVQQLIAGKAERMPSDSEKGGVYKLTRDPRITSVGSLLRRTSLDELPQLINVLRGEMSLVGPRPAVPYEVEAYDLWHRNRILDVKPGITGLWQVNGRSRVKFDEMVRLDLRYARACSFWLDVKILCMTPFAVLFGEGAY